MLVLAGRDKKKSAPGKIYKQTVQNISCFNKERIFIITNRRNIGKNKTFFCLEDIKNNNFLSKSFQRHKLFAILNNFE